MKKIFKKNKLNKDKFLLVYLLLCSFLIISDQLIKYLIVKNLKLKEGFILIPKILKITFFKNYGAAFSILVKKTNLLIFFTISIITFFLFYILKSQVKDKLKLLFTTMIVSGGISNLIDRFLKGFVVDYINLLFWPFKNFAVFNLADCYIVFGSILFLLKFIKDEFFINKFKKNIRI